mmetsp:Transcript_85298/g.241867  ORF Transcript_85298/g.241867 Transcript_85298/m.241867 type:complete len:276 (+) Transcript_85298:403-1230(+)
MALGLASSRSSCHWGGAPGSSLRCGAADLLVASPPAAPCSRPASSGRGTGSCGGQRTSPADQEAETAAEADFCLDVMCFRRSSTRAIWLLICVDLVCMNFRRSTMSRTVAVLLPRCCSTSFMNSLNPSCLLYSRPLSSLWKITSAKSTSPTTSTPASWRCLAVSLLSRMCSSSSLEMSPSPFWSSPVSSSTCRTFSFTNDTTRCSFSATETLLTTSTSTPTRRFSRSSAEIRMTAKNSRPPTMFPEPRSARTTPGPSRRVAVTSSVYIDWNTVLK